MWRASPRRLEAAMSVIECPSRSISAPVSSMLTPAIADLSPTIKRLANTAYRGKATSTASVLREQGQTPPQRLSDDRQTAKFGGGRLPPQLRPRSRDKKERGRTDHRHFKS